VEASPRILRSLDNAGLNELAKLLKLESLSLEHAPLSDDQFACLTPSTLLHLNVAHTKVLGVGFNHLRRTLVSLNVRALSDQRRRLERDSRVQAPALPEDQQRRGSHAEAERGRLHGISGDEVVSVAGRGRRRGCRPFLKKLHRYFQKGRHFCGRMEKNNRYETLVTRFFRVIGPCALWAVGLSLVRCVCAGHARSQTWNCPQARAVPTGSLAAWGFSSGTELTVPTGVSDLVDVSSYNGSAIGCRANGSVVTWGYGYIPNPITNGVAVGTGFGIYAVLKSDGKVVAWGFNHYGQTTVPSTLSGVSKIAVGTDHMLALKSNGTVVAWGRNDQNQCKVPAGLTGVVAIDAATYGSVALKSNGTVVAWGSSTYTSIPPGLTGVAAIAVNESGGLALKGDGTLVFWGSGSVGTLPPGLSGITGIAMGEYHAVALKNDGTLVCWGDEYYGECTVPVGLGPVNKVYADRYRTLARFAGVNFDQHGLLDTSPVRTFTVRNTGTTALSLTSVTLTTGDTADFLLDTTGMLSSIPAGSTTSFTVAFRAQTKGSKFTTLRLVSDDGDEFHAGLCADRRRGGPGHRGEWQWIADQQWRHYACDI